MMKNGFLTNLWTSIWRETKKTKYISATPAVTEANVNICYQRMQQQKQDGIRVHSVEKILDAIIFVPHCRFFPLAYFRITQKKLQALNMKYVY